MAGRQGSPPPGHFFPRAPEIEKLCLAEDRMLEIVQASGVGGFPRLFYVRR
jgi:hypothetical protein